MIECKNISYTYEDGSKALQNVSVNLTTQKVYGIFGENGAGKSTLFHLVMGLYQPTSGELFYDGKPYFYSKKGMKQLRNNVSMVFQDPNKQIFHTSVRADIGYALFNQGVEEKVIQERVDQKIEQFDLQDIQDKPVHFLSYGQKKRVAIAGALISDCRVLLLDEPLVGLDPRMKEDMIGYLNEIKKTTTLLIASHDLDFLLNMCDQAVILKKGKLVDSLSINEIPEKVLKEELEFPVPLRMRLRNYFKTNQVLNKSDYERDFD